MNLQKQKGFAHLVIFIILALVIIGGLGFVYWQNFANKDNKDNTMAQQDIPTDLKIAMKTFFPKMEVVSVSKGESSSAGSKDLGYTCLLHSTNSKINKLYLESNIFKDSPLIELFKKEEENNIAQQKKLGIKTDNEPRNTQLKTVTINGHSWAINLQDDPKGANLDDSIFMDIDKAESRFVKLAEKINKEIPETVVLHFQYDYNEEVNSYDAGKGLVVSLLYVPKAEFRYTSGYSDSIDDVKKINVYKYNKSSDSWNLISTRDY